MALPVSDTVLCSHQDGSPCAVAPPVLPVPGPPPGSAGRERREERSLHGTGTEGTFNNGINGQLLITSSKHCVYNKCQQRIVNEGLTVAFNTLNACAFNKLFTAYTVYIFILTLFGPVKLLLHQG